MIPFHETGRGQRFFDVQLPKLIAALTDIAASLKAPRPIYQLKAEVSEQFLSDLYLGNYDPSEQPATELDKELTQAIIAVQNQLRKVVPADSWTLISEYGELLTARNTADRERAFVAGFQSAMTMLAAGLAKPAPEERE